MNLNFKGQVQKIRSLD